MLIVGITGGIGSGKSVVSRIIEVLGYPVYNADDRAREILKVSSVVRAKVIELLGEEAYSNGDPNRQYIASRVFNDDNLLRSLNAIVHPAVGEDFQHWMDKQDTGIVFKEAAIMIESGTYKDCDRIILVSCPDPIRIRRVMERDSVAEADVKKRMEAQMTDVEKLPFSHFQIMNDETELVIPQVLSIVSKLKG